MTANAKTTYWADMSFAKTNIEGLKNEIYYYGNTDASGNKYIYYKSQNYDYTHTITYNISTDVLSFYTDYAEDGDYVSLYYTYPNLVPQVGVLSYDGAAVTTATFKAYEYYNEDIVFTVKSNSGLTNAYIQEMSNLNLQAAVEGWQNCLSENTSYTLQSIGFCGLCNHNMTTTYEAATFKNDAMQVDYCYYCGYNEETDYASIGKISLSKTKYTYDGKAKKPTVTVKDNAGKTIAASNYSVKYQSGRKTPGKYSVTVNFINGKYQGSKTLYFTIVPKATTLSSVTAKSKGFTVKWKKLTTQTSGYQIQYSTDKNFKKNNKTVTVSKNGTTSKTISKLKSKKKYYVRIRTYKMVSGTKYYSSWSKSKAVTTKK